MAKFLAVTTIPASNNLANRRCEIARFIKLTSMSFEGKVNLREYSRIDEFTVQRRWRDQEAIDEYIDFLRDLESRYGIKITKVQITDL